MFNAAEWRTLYDDDDDDDDDMITKQQYTLLLFYDANYSKKSEKCLKWTRITE